VKISKRKEDSMDYDEDYLEKVFNQTYPGLTMYVRDVNLPDAIAQKYTKGLVVREKAFCDASSRVMGMITSHRYGILSNHMAGLSEFEHGTNWGLHVANKDSRFKVLATHKHNGKMLILLLHLPDDDGWKIFQNLSTNVDDDMTTDSIERFENKCNAEVIPELATNEWLKRCDFPIGMDSNGNMFELE